MKNLLVSVNDCVTQLSPYQMLTIKRLHIYFASLQFRETYCCREVHKITKKMPNSLADHSANSYVLKHIPEDPEYRLIQGLPHDELGG